MLTFLVVATSLSLLFWTLAVMALADNYEKEPKLNSHSYAVPQGEVPLVSVIIPARNEEQRVKACLEAVLAQDYPRFEVIVVDDRSEDRTAEIVEGLARTDDRVRRVRGKPLPSGWAGKCHAIHQGVEMAEGTWLLMLDTDTYLEPHCLSATVQDAIAKEVDLYTLIFEAQCQSFWEKVCQPLFFQFILMAMPLHKVNDPEGKEAAAPGPFLLFRRSTYEAIGGHAGMKDEVVEDLRLAQRIKEEGYRLHVVNAVPLATSRRRIGLKEIWHGWSRVLYSGLGKSPLIGLLAFLGMGLFLLLPWFVAPYSLWEIFTGNTGPARIALLSLGLTHCFVFLAIRKMLHVFYRLDMTKAWLQPLAVVIAMAILVNSMLREGGSRTVVWRGRRY